MNFQDCDFHLSPPHSRSGFFFVTDALRPKTRKRGLRCLVVMRGVELQPSFWVHDSISLGVTLQLQCMMVKNSFEIV